MNVQLKEVSCNTLFDRETGLCKGKFINYELEMGKGLTFTVVRFLPNFAGARETLTRIKFEMDGYEEQELFSAKKFIQPGTLIFLAEVGGQMVIYRLSQTANRSMIDMIWQVTSDGVHYPGTGEQKDPAVAAALKARLAALEDALPVFDSAEMPFKKAAQAALQKAEAIAEAELMAKVQAERQEAAEKAAAERAAAAAEKNAKALERATEKARLMAPGNRRSFKRTDGIDMSGFVVTDLEQAKQLPAYKVAVLLGADGQHVAKAYFIKKTAGGHVTFDEIDVATESTPHSAASVTASPEAPALKLAGKFLTLVRPEGKRKPGKHPVVAQVVTAEEFAHLKAHRPDAPKQVALSLPSGAYHVYRVTAKEVVDLGRMVEQPSEVPAAEKPAKQPAGKHKAIRTEKRQKFGVLLVAQ